MLVKCEPSIPMKTEPTTTTEIRKRNKHKRSNRKLITTFHEEKQSQEYKHAALFIKQKLLANYIPDELPPRLESQYK
jgi:hypothetical protein